MPNRNQTTLKYFIYILYRYYKNSKHNHDIAMFMAILSFTGFFYLNVISVLLISGSLTKIASFGLSQIPNINWLYVNMGFYFLACVIIGVFIREKNMTGLDKKYKSLHGWLMLLYFISSFFFFSFAATHKPEEQNRPEEIFIEVPRRK